MSTSFRRATERPPGVTTLELFYDLVFVFAVTQVSHLLLQNLTWTGAGQAAMVLLVVWWSWNFTTWAVNELDADATPVRLLLLALMLACLMMAIAIPQAFGDRALLFAATYVLIQTGRHTFLAFVAAGPGTLERERAARILGWFVGAGVLWIAGALADGTARTVLWLLALAIDYSGPLSFYWAPRRNLMRGGAWTVESSHFAERFQAFVIIALGESVVITGATSSELELDTTRTVAIGLAFLSSAAFWWLYFHAMGPAAQRRLEQAPDRTNVARDVFTYLHVVLIAGIVVSAVGDELVIAHPTETLTTPQLLALVAGPVLYLVAQDLVQWRITGSPSRSRRLAIAGCIGAGLVGTTASALTVAALLAVVLVALVVHDTRSAGTGVGAATHGAAPVGNGVET